MKKIEILAVSLCVVLACGLACAECSSDPNSFDLIKNTAWLFNFSHGGASYSKAIGFLPEVAISTTTGDAFLGATDGDYAGLVVYGDTIGGSGKSFICTLQNQENKKIFNVYQFNIHEEIMGGNIATGTFFYYDQDNSSNFWQSSLIGSKVIDSVLDNQNQPIQTDQNQQIVDTDQIKDLLSDTNQPAQEKSLDSKSSGDGGGGCFIESIHIPSSFLF